MGWSRACDSEMERRMASASFSHVASSFLACACRETREEARYESCEKSRPLERLKSKDRVGHFCHLLIWIGGSDWAHLFQVLL